MDINLNYNILKAVYLIMLGTITVVFIKILEKIRER